MFGPLDEFSKKIPDIILLIKRKSVPAGWLR